MTEEQPSAGVHDNKIEDDHSEHGFVGGVVPGSIAWLVDVRANDGRQLDAHVIETMTVSMGASKGDPEGEELAYADATVLVPTVPDIVDTQDTWMAWTHG